MLKNHKLAKSISSVSWAQFFDYLCYKCEWYGGNYVEIGRFEPSSKMCTCGTINRQLELKDREWTCSTCGAHHDRDLLAANNIKRFGLDKQNLLTLSGAGSSGGSVELPTIVEAVKQKGKLKYN